MYVVGFLGIVTKQIYSKNVMLPGIRYMPYLVLISHQPGQTERERRSRLG